MSDFSFEVIKHIGMISENNKGWKKELNLVSWNGRAPKYDIRDWSPDREKMGKGITLNDDEINRLKEILNNLQ